MDAPTPAVPATPDPLAAAGLAPAPVDVPAPAAAVPDIAPAAPAAPAPIAAPAAEEEIVVPAGAENPDAVKNAIAAERKAARDANARARQLQADLEAQQNASKPLEEQVAESNRKSADADLRATRLEVAAEAGIDLKLASRLQGTTREELTADAETFKPLIGAAPTPTVPPEGGVRPQPPAKPDPVTDHNNLLAQALGARSPRSGSQSILSGLEPAPED
jgi:hypothetical protein